jgi:predicted ATPase
MKHSQQFTALLQAIATIQAKVVEKINAEKVGRETQHGRPVPAGLFVEGGPGRGKSTMLEQMYQEVAADLKVPDDR